MKSSNTDSFAAADLSPAEKRMAVEGSKPGAVHIYRTQLGFDRLRSEELIDIGLLQYSILLELDRIRPHLILTQTKVLSPREDKSRPFFLYSNLSIKNRPLRVYDRNGEVYDSDFDSEVAHIKDGEKFAQVLSRTVLRTLAIVSGACAYSAVRWDTDIASLIAEDEARIVCELQKGGRELEARKKKNAAIINNIDKYFEGENLGVVALIIDDESQVDVSSLAEDIATALGCAVSISSWPHAIAPVLARRQQRLLEKQARLKALEGALYLGDDEWCLAKIVNETGRDAVEAAQLLRALKSMHPTVQTLLLEWWHTGKLDLTFSVEGWSIKRIMDRVGTTEVCALQWLNAIMLRPEETFELLYMRRCVVKYSDEERKAAIKRSAH